MTNSYAFNIVHVQTSIGNDAVSNSCGKSWKTVSHVNETSLLALQYISQYQRGMVALEDLGPRDRIIMKSDMSISPL